MGVKEKAKDADRWLGNKQWRVGERACIKGQGERWVLGTEPSRNKVGKLSLVMFNFKAAAT